MDPDPSPRRSRAGVVAIGVVLLLGAGIRTVQFASDNALWHDEIMLARNVEDRDLVGLVTRPLDHGQVAPVGILALHEAATTALGVNDTALRFTPWLLGLVSLLLFWRVSRRFVSTPALLAGLVVFACGVGWIWYGASPKQYGADVAVTLLLLWLALRWREEPGDLRFGLLAGLGGGLALLLSHPAVVVACLIGGILAVDWATTRPRPPKAPLAAMASGWALGALVATLASLATLDRGVGGYMEEFHAAGFPPPATEPVALLLWGPRQIASVFGHALFYEPFGPLRVVVGLLLVLAIIGAWHLARRHPRRAALLAAPVGAGLAAAAFHLLPFRHRLGVYTAAPLLVFTMWGLEALWRGLPGRSRHAASGLAVLTAAPFLVVTGFLYSPPLPTQESRGVLAELEHRREPGDVLYVTCGGHQAVPFYGPDVGIESWDQGGCHEDPRSHLREVDAYRGRPRVWLFHMQSHGMADLLRDYLGTIGTVRDSIPDPWGMDLVGAYLYDLSDPDRLERATAGTFPVQGYAEE